MSLLDTTNMDIPLSIHGGEPITIDHDFDSSLTPKERIVFYGNPEDQDLFFYATYEEAVRIRDRLNLILGVDTEDTVE